MKTKTLCTTCIHFKETRLPSLNNPHKTMAIIEQPNMMHVSNNIFPNGGRSLIDSFIMISCLLCVAC